MKRNQNGIALVESLLIILILTIIGFGGYYVWHSQKQTDKTNADTLKAGESQVVSDPSSSTKTLDIKEWGVKAQYKSNVNLVYKIKTDDIGEVWAQMSSVELVNSDPQNCSIESQLGGIIVRIHSGEHLRGPAGDDTGVSVNDAISNGSLSEYSHVGDYYYYYEHPQAACGTDGSNSSNLQSKTLEAVKQAAKSFEAQ